MDEDEWLAIGSIVTVGGILIICMSTTIYHCTKNYICIRLRNFFYIYFAIYAPSVSLK